MTDTLHIIHPSTPNLMAARNGLLGATLREQPTPWAIAAEYPIVLDHSHTNTSYCVMEGDQIIAHANLWPRAMTRNGATESLDITLIGNVATTPTHRGKGIMRNLFLHLEHIALSQGSSALVLWSDLLEFYQNLGFTSIGREWRCTVRCPPRITNQAVQIESFERLSDSDLNCMLALRPRMAWNLTRSTSEFRQLLSIPDCVLCVGRVGGKITSWFVMGKGADMIGVVHEWGAESPQELLTAIQNMLFRAKIAETLVLVPAALPGAWQTYLRRETFREEGHFMALAKPLGVNGSATLKALADTFIWGLDSI